MIWVTLLVSYLRCYTEQAQTSSNTSRTAAPQGSSSGSIPPPGTIHWSGCRLLLTSNTWQGVTTALVKPWMADTRAESSKDDDISCPMWPGICSSSEAWTFTPPYLITTDELSWDHAIGWTGICEDSSPLAAILNATLYYFRDEQWVLWILTATLM